MPYCSALLIVETTGSIEEIDSHLRAYCLESLQSKYSLPCSVHFLGEML